MDLSLEGKVAIVTGGSKGIGRATALALAQEGVDVAICARGVEDLEGAAAEIRSKTARKALAVQADMGDPDDIKNLVAATVASSTVMFASFAWRSKSMVESQDIADLILFLVSDRAGAITGQTIAVEGGAGRGMHY